MLAKQPDRAKAADGDETDNGNADPGRHRAVQADRLRTPLEASPDKRSVREEGDADDEGRGHDGDRDEDQREGDETSRQSWGESMMYRGREHGEGQRHDERECDRTLHHGLVLAVESSSARMALASRSESPPMNLLNTCVRSDVESSSSLIRWAASSGSSTAAG